MPAYHYRAKDPTGKEVFGTQDAADPFELARALRSESLLLLRAEDEAAQGKLSFGHVKISQSLLKILQRIRLTDKIIFSKNLSVMIGAGLSLTRALDALSREAKPRFKEIIEDITRAIREGKTFTEGLGAHPEVFPPLYAAMVESGEKTGNLKESLEILASQMQADNDLIRKVRGAMIYPAVILVAMIIVGILMLIYVVPTLSTVFEELDADLPTSTKTIIGISNLFVNHTFLLIGGLVGFVFLIIQFSRMNVGRRFFDNVFLRAPLLSSLVKQFNAARTSRTLSSLLSGGVQIIEALDVTSRVVQNHKYQELLEEAKAEIQKGNKISEVFLKHPNLYPSLVGEMLAVGEETGATPKMLQEIALFYEAQVNEITKNLSTIIEPVLMIIIGAFVGFFAVSMIIPIYSISSSI